VSKFNLTAEYVRNALHYNADNGIFIWRDHRIDKYIGQLAGYKMQTGYWLLTMKDNRFLAHRVAWLYCYGKMPEHGIDHINGVRDDNRIVNLRDVSQAGNLRNRRTANRNNQTGLLGVAIHGKKFNARIMAHGRLMLLGDYDTPEEAHQVYLEAKRRLHDTCSI
jgi:hypothetical protein